MNIHGFFISLFSWLVTIPAALLCLAPMKNQFRFRGAKAITLIALLSVVFLTIISAIESRLSPGYNGTLPFLAIVTFTAYHRSLRVPLAKSLSIYALVFTLMAFISNCANGFDAILHPDRTLEDFSLEAAVFQLILSIVVSLALYYPMEKYGSRLIDNFDILLVWYVTIPISGIFFACNLILAPRKYETLYVNNVFRFFWIAIALLSLLLLLLCALFYFIVSGMMRAAQVQERNRILEMQESSYLAQQRYMAETARIRHDFRHTLGALDELVTKGDLTAIRAYLDGYLAAQPKNETASFCENTAVNALLNYYMRRAQDSHITLDWEISFPKSSGIKDIDFCSILGNTLENAILACETLTDAERFIDLSMRYDDSGIYIVATNPFDGKIKKKNGYYLSTRRHGSGIGLKSIASTAEKCGGSARFSHEGTEFYTDIVLPIHSILI